VGTREQPSDFGYNAKHMFYFTYDIRMLYLVVFAGFLASRVFRALKYRKFDLWRELLLFGLMLYIAFLLYNTFEPFAVLLKRQNQRINLVPLQGIFRMIENASKFDDKVTQRIVFVNLAGNVLLFSVFGMVFPLLHERLNRWWLVVLLGISFSLVIELGQTFLIHRVFDVDDLILNGLGTLIGFSVYAFLNLFKPFRQFCKRIREAARPHGFTYSFLFLLFVLLATIGVYQHGLALFRQIPQ